MPVTAVDIMTKKVLTVKPEDKIATVARMLSDHDISALPVCDTDGSVVGIVSESDLLLAPATAANANGCAWWLGLVANGKNLEPSVLDCIKTTNTTVREVMVVPVTTAAPDTAVQELARLFVTTHIKRLPVVDAGKLVGIVSRADLVRLLAQTPDAIATAI